MMKAILFLFTMIGPSAATHLTSAAGIDVRFEADDAPCSPDFCCTSCRYFLGVWTCWGCGGGTQCDGNVFSCNGCYNGSGSNPCVITDTANSCCGAAA